MIWIFAGFLANVCIVSLIFANLDPTLSFMKHRSSSWIDLIVINTDLKYRCSCPIPLTRSIYQTLYGATMTFFPEISIALICEKDYIYFLFFVYHSYQQALYQILYDYISSFFFIDRRCARSCIFLLPLLGITWMFGMLSLAGLGIEFDYVFTACNSIQVTLLMSMNR